MTHDMKKSALYDLVVRHSDFDFDTFMATAVADEDYDDWNQYCLPVKYTDCDTEYRAIRDGAAIFDASPMKKYRFTGEDCGALLDRLFTAPVTNTPVMKAAYALMCNDDGFLYDDGIVLKLAEDEFLLLTSFLDLSDYFDAQNDFVDASYVDESEAWAGFALQGPKSCAVLKTMGIDGIEELEPFALKWVTIDGVRALVGRLGFTGDLGYEVWFDQTVKQTIINAVIRAEEKVGIPLRGYGLDALQICRIEAGMIVPGWDTAGLFENDLNERTPYEMTLGWNVRLKREENFTGKAALVRHKEKGARFKMKACVVSDDMALDFGAPIYINQDGDRIQIGTLPSIVWHPVRGEWIGFASIESDYSLVESAYVCNGDKQASCKFQSLPFIDLPQRSAVPAPS